MKIEKLQEKIVWITSVGLIFIIIGGLFLKYYEVRNTLLETTKCQYVMGNEFKYCIDAFSLKNDGNITGWLIKPEEDMNTVAIKVVFKQKNGKKAYIIPTTMQERKDVSDAMADGKNYDHSGFDVKMYNVSKKLDVQGKEYVLCFYVKINGKEYLYDTQKTLWDISEEMQ